MQPAGLYIWVGVFLAFPIVTTCLALFNWNSPPNDESKVRSQGQLTGLRLLLLQTLIPPLQFLPLLRSVTTPPSRFASDCVMLLPVASLLLGGASLYFLILNSRQLARLVLPMLNVLVFTYSAALFVAAGATA
jgi:hypothetical protein